MGRSVHITIKWFMLKKIKIKKTNKFFRIHLGCVWIRGCGGVESWGWVRVEVWRKLRLFGLEYVRVDMWGKFIEICEWCDSCKHIINYFE